MLRPLPDRRLADEFAAGAAALDRIGGFPHANLARLHEEGLLALTVGRDEGGQQAGLSRAAALVGTIAQGCASTALVLSMQLIHQKTAATNPAWPEHLRQRVGRGAAVCGALMNALRVEPAMGSPARGGLPETVARRTAFGWSITGHKLYSTGAPGLSWMLVWARTDEADPRTGFWLIPARSAGVEIVETWDHLGLRASGSHDVLFHGVEVTEDHAVDLRAPSAWAQRDPMQAAWSTLMVGSLYTGVATAAQAWLVEFMKGRVPTGLGVPLSTLPRIQEAIGEMEARLLVNRRLVASAASEHDQGATPSLNELQLLKTVACSNAIAVVQQAVELCGNPGLSRTNPLERHLRDVLCSRIHTPQADAAHTAAGRQVLGL